MTSARRHFGRLAAARGGVSAIEFALLLPAFILLFFGVVEFARVIWTQVSLQHAVEAAARCVSVGQCTSGNAPTYAAQQTYGLTIAVGDFSATSSSCGAKVSATVPFSFALPSLFPWQITLKALSCYPLQS